MVGSVVAPGQTRPQIRPRDSCPLRDRGRGLVVGVGRLAPGQQSPFLTWEFDHVYWQQASGGGAAPMAAGASLKAMRRRVRLSRLAVWTVIAAGLVALASTPSTVAAAPATPTTVRTVDPRSASR